MKVAILLASILVSISARAEHVPTEIWKAHCDLVGDGVFDSFDVRVEDGELTDLKVRSTELWGGQPVRHYHGETQLETVQAAVEGQALRFGLQFLEPESGEIQIALFEVRATHGDGPASSRIAHGETEVLKWVYASHDDYHCTHTWMRTPTRR